MTIITTADVSSLLLVVAVGFVPGFVIGCILTLAVERKGPSDG